jgi:hypothetical protein
VQQNKEEGKQDWIEDPRHIFLIVGGDDDVSDYDLLCMYPC